MAREARRSERLTAAARRAQLVEVGRGVFARRGYEATSVVKAASKLHGKLLIVHGIMDDNVHVQNTLQLV